MANHTNINGQRDKVTQWDVQHDVRERSGLATVYRVRHEARPHCRQWNNLDCAVCHPLVSQFGCQVGKVAVSMRFVSILRRPRRM